MKTIILVISLASIALGAPSGYGYSAPALKAAPYSAPIRAEPAYTEVHSRELTGYRNEVLRIPEVHTEAVANPTQVEIRGNPYQVKTIRQETRAVQGFRDETVPRTEYHDETITKQSYEDQVITIPGTRTETRAVQDFKEEVIRVPFTRYESYEVPTEEQRVIQVPKVEYETIRVPETVYDHIRVPETHYETIEVPEFRTEVSYDSSVRAGYATAIDVPSVREEIHQVPIYEDVVKRVALPQSYGYSAPALKAGY